MMLLHKQYSKSMIFYSSNIVHINILEEKKGGGGGGGFKIKKV